MELHRIKVDLRYREEWLNLRIKKIVSVGLAATLAVGGVLVSSEAAQALPPRTCAGVRAEYTDALDLAQRNLNWWNNTGDITFYNEYQDWTARADQISAEFAFCT